MDEFCGKHKMTWLEAEMLIERDKGIGHFGKRRGSRKEKRYYFCDRCKSFHVTSSDSPFVKK